MLTRHAINDVDTLLISRMSWKKLIINIKKCIAQSTVQVEDREWLLLMSSNIYYIVHEMHVVHTLPNTIMMNNLMNELRCKL